MYSPGYGAGHDTAHQEIAKRLTPVTMVYSLNPPAFPLAATATSFMLLSRAIPFTLWIEDFSFRYATAAGTDATNFWTVSLVRVDSAGASTIIASQVLNTVVTTFITVPCKVQLLLVDAYRLRIDCTKTLAAGTLNIDPVVIRLRDSHFN